MYQFSEMFKELNPDAAPPNYRWRGLAFGILLGCLPGWALAHWVGGGAWAVMGGIVLTPVLGYFFGSKIKK